MSKKVSVAVNGKSQRSIAMSLYDMDFNKFAESCCVAKKGGKYESYFIRGGDMAVTEADSGHKNPECRIDHFHRNDASLLSADLLILDADGSIDDEGNAPDGALIHKTIKKMGIAHFIYSTHSHHINGKGNRYRVVMPCKMKHKAYLRPTVDKIINEIRSFDCPLGDVKEAKAWSQAWFFPTRDNPDDGLFEYYDYMDGDAYEPVHVETRLTDEMEERRDTRKYNKNEEKTDQRSHETIVKNIITGTEGLHHAINDFLYGQLKDGVAKGTAIATCKGLMMANPCQDERWQDRFNEIERSADGAYDRLNHADGDVLNDIEKIKKSLGSHKQDLAIPDYPFNCMEGWPEPWPQIWENWKRFPAVVSEPLLIPTILSFHGYFLNGKYLNARDRRPNLYQLSLAESTAYKDTNSTDVLRAMPKAMADHGIINSVFDGLADGDSNITSDTAFVKSLIDNDNKKFWINTEATRVFQQLSSNGGYANPNVLALADKMIEVVDGKAITGKAKANEAIKSVDNPNIQIVFYAQPETIEKYIGEDMVDSGFLGRALITLDVTEQKEHSMFMALPDNFCKLDDDLAAFYGNCDLNSKKVFERMNVPLYSENLEAAMDFERDVLKPLMPENDGPLRKMITRMGNSTEQLFSIVYGVCCEWDEWQGNVVRSAAEIDIKPLFPLLEFWAKCKSFVVNEYILSSADPAADAVVEGLLKFLDGEWTVESKYDEYLIQGLIPRALLINRMRTLKSVKVLSNNSFVKTTALLSQTIDYLVNNQVLGQSEIKMTRSNKKTKFLYVSG